jgi:hypothetical protein
MKIRMLQALATVTTCYQQGLEYDVADDYGRQLIKGKLAVAVTPSEAAKTGEVPPPTVRLTMDEPQGQPVEELRPPPLTGDAPPVVTTAAAARPGPSPVPDGPEDANTAAKTEAKAEAERDDPPPRDLPRTAKRGR